MRALFFALVLGVTGAALLPSHQAQAWWDHWGRWHGGYYRRGFVVVAPPVLAPVPVYPRPYAHWIRPHYDYYGRFIPGHWV